MLNIFHFSHYFNTTKLILYYILQIGIAKQKKEVFFEQNRFLKR